MPTILVIDDNANLLNLVKTTLEKQAYSVLLASNANEGLDLAIEKEPDLIITDLAMPGKDGFIFIQDLRGGGFQKPVLATSGGLGTSVEDFLQAAKDAGATDTLAKPFKPQDLLKKVSSLLQQQE